jgi:hypothetical protein
VVYCISRLVGEVAVPCLSSAHSSSTCCQCIPWPPLNARPRVPLVASTTVLVLSCLCVLLLSCLSCPASRRRQEGLNSLARSPPACLHAQPPCYLPPAAHSHPHSLLSCPAAAVTVPSDSQRVTETAACAQQLHPPARQITPATSYQHTGAQQHDAENCAIAQRTRGSTTLVRPPSLSSYGCSGIFPRRRRRSGSRRPLCPHLLLAQAVRWPLVVRLVATMAAQHAEQRRDAQAIRGAQSQVW